MWNINKLIPKREIEVPENLFIKCPTCGELVTNDAVRKNLYICPECNENLKVPAPERIEYLVDKGSFEEIILDQKIQNPIDFPGYEKKIKKLRKQTGLIDGIQIGKASIYDKKVIIGVMDSRFLMGSMGSYVGEVITQAFEIATAEKLPLVLYTASGGARMQEGIVSLMQMAKISAAIKRHSEAGLLYMPILTNPTTGGVTASFAMLGDVICAEEKALICFAGPRVIKETIKEELPEGFQKSEFLLKHGFIDKILPRSIQREFIYQMLSVHERKTDE